MTTVIANVNPTVCSTHRTRQLQINDSGSKSLNNEKTRLPKCTSDTLRMCDGETTADSTYEKCT